MKRALPMMAALPMLLPLSGCVWLMGEYFVHQEMVHPKTGEKVGCDHGGRTLTRAEMNKFNACVTRYKSQGYVCTEPRVRDVDGLTADCD